MRRLLVLFAAAVLPLAGAAAPASATPAVWKWGPVHSADGMAGSWGKVYLHQFGYLVEGKLEDTRGKGCAWAVLKAQDRIKSRRLQPVIVPPANARAAEAAGWASSSAEPGSLTTADSGNVTCSAYSAGRPSWSAVNRSIVAVSSPAIHR